MSLKPCKIKTACNRRKQVKREVKKQQQRETRKMRMLCKAVVDRLVAERIRERIDSLPAMPYGSKRVKVQAIVDQENNWQ